MAKKVLFGIFAHPDDETFGPCGTILQEISTGTEVHLVTLTAGDSGENPDGHDDLSVVRLNEWRTAGELMGASSMNCLGYRDGHLSNDSLLSAYPALEKLVKTVLKKHDAETEVEFMCFDLNGISGHIDHITTSRLACLVYYRLKLTDNRLKRIRFFCIPRERSPQVNTSWIYMEEGRSPEEIDETIDARQFNPTIAKAIRIHRSQRSDGERHIKHRGDDLGLNYFYIRE